MGEEYHRQMMVLGQVSNLGPIIMYDDMEGVLKWTFSGDGAYTGEKDATTAYNGSYCLHLKSRAAAVPGDVVSANRLTYQRPGKRYAIEMIWNVVDQTKNAHLKVQIVIYDGTTEHVLYVEYIGTLEKWQYINAAGAEADIPGGAQSLVNVGWHRLELQYDENAKKYIRLVSDGKEIDMTGLGYYTAASGTGSQQQLKIELMTALASPVEGRVDDVLIREV